MLKNCVSQHNHNCLELFSVNQFIRKTWPCYVRTIKVYTSFYRSMSASWQHNLHIKKTYYPHKFFFKEKINGSYYFSNWSCQLSFQASWWACYPYHSNSRSKKKKKHCSASVPKWTKPLIISLNLRASTWPWLIHFRFLSSAVEQYLTTLTCYLQWLLGIN